MALKLGAKEKKCLSITCHLWCLTWHTVFLGKYLSRSVVPQVDGYGGQARSLWGGWSPKRNAAIRPQKPEGWTWFSGSQQDRIAEKWMCKLYWRSAPSVNVQMSGSLKRAHKSRPMVPTYTLHYWTIASKRVHCKLPRPLISRWIWAS